MASTETRPSRAAGTRPPLPPEPAPLQPGGVHDSGRTRRDTLFILGYIFGVPLVLWSVLHLGLGWL